MHGDFWWQGVAPRPAQDIVQDMHDSHKQLDEIKALTMHKMVDEYETPNGTKKLIFFTNYQVWQKRHGAYNSKTLDCMLEMSPFLNFPLLQAALFTIENIHSMISAYEFPKPKLVITFMPCSGSSHTINHGMIDAVRLENRLPLSRLLVF